MRKILATITALVLFLGTSTPLWADYKYVRSFTINEDQCGGVTLSNFPLPFNFVDTAFTTAVYGGHIENANAYDFNIYTDVGLTTKAKWYVKYFDPPNNRIAGMVQVNTNATYYIAYGDSSLTTAQSTSTDVWTTNYQLVDHQSDGFSLADQDETTHANHGTITAGGAIQDGVMDGAATWNGTDAMVDWGTVSGLNSTTGFFIQGWWRPSNTSTPFQHMMDKGDYTVAGFDIQTDGGTESTQDIGILIAKSGTPYYALTTSAPLQNNVWKHFAFLFNGAGADDDARLKTYVNSVAQTLYFPFGGTVPSSIDVSSNHLTLSTPVASGDNWYAGDTDEIQVYNGVPTNVDAVVACTYNAQKSTPSVINLGDETSLQPSSLGGVFKSVVIR
jgi:hypothetical protein